nr:MAG TPA: hypothetical protein [Caudoviricetes sp.]
MGFYLHNRLARPALALAIIGLGSPVSSILTYADLISTPQ